MLEKNDYHFGKDSQEEAFEKIGSSLAEYLQTMKAIWYHDIIRDDYESIKRFDAKGNRIRSRIIRDPQKISRNRAIKLKNSHEYAFEIKNIIDVLRTYYNLDQRDILEITSPTYLVNELGPEELIEKSERFFDKAFYGPQELPFNFWREYGRNHFWSFFKYPLRNHAPEEKYKEFEERIKVEDCEGFARNLARDYLGLTSRLLIAYIGDREEDAIEFFERETGIKLSSKPIEYKKLVI